MKKMVILLLLSLLVGSAFAADWVKYGTYENDADGVYDVYFDFEATEPFDLEKESIKYFLGLQKGYEKVEVHLYNMEDWMWCVEGVEHNCYATLIMKKDFREEYHVNNDGTVTVYTFSGFKNK